MNKRQFAMFMQILKERGKAQIKNDYFYIMPRLGSVYKLTYHNNGKMSVLHVGTYDECVDVVKDFITMTYEITD